MMPNWWFRTGANALPWVWARVALEGQRVMVTLRVWGSKALVIRLSISDQIDIKIKAVLQNDSIGMIQMSGYSYILRECINAYHSSALSEANCLMSFNGVISTQELSLRCQKKAASHTTSSRITNHKSQVCEGPFLGSSSLFIGTWQVYSGFEWGKDNAAWE